MSRWQDKDEDDLDETEDPDESDQDVDDDSSDTLPCPHCRREIHEDSQRCPHCGHYVAMDSIPRRNARWLIVAAILALLAVLIWLIL